NVNKCRVTADDAAYATFRLAGDVVAHFNSSWSVRVRRDDLVTFQVDGTKGSAVAGLTRCFAQSLAETPRPVWNPDVRQTHDFGADWKEVPDDRSYDNAFKVEWARFIRHGRKESVQSHRARRGPRGRGPSRPRESLARCRSRLGCDPRLPALPVVARPRRGRSDGHGATRHGTRVEQLARADPPLDRRVQGHRRRGAL